MNTEKAIKILTQVNKWRRDNNVPAKEKMPDPKEFGKAIDFAIYKLKQINK